MKLPLPLMRRKLYHLRRWQFEIEQHLIHCQVAGMERDGMEAEKRECLHKIVRLNQDIERAELRGKKKK